MEKNKFEYEKEIRNFWENNQIYEKVKQKNKGGQKFNFVEGPPYPTGEAHLGHLRNWAIKDSVLRFKRYEGYDVYARDGYDAHGLPVENKTQNKLGLKTVDEIKEFGVDKFIGECRNYAYGIIDDMKDLRARYALWMDRDPYLTFHPEYISMAWNVFKKADEKKLLYKDYKTVAWCPHDETTLSDYEIKDTYKTLEDPSVYVRFPVKKEFWSTKVPEYLLIWTTTPWTLQSNMAIAVNPLFDYSKVLVEVNGKEEILIVAASLAESVIKKLSKQSNVKFKRVFITFKGAELDGVKYDHIYYDETPSQQQFANMDNKHIHSVIMADFVTLDEGEDILDKLEKKGYKHSVTGQEAEKEKAESKKPKAEGSGLVHIAPGHGFDDYNVGKRYDIPIFCPVDRQGKFTEGKYKDMYFKDVDPIAIDYLKKKGFLLFADKKSHRYPCCWRCKTPIVYRAADQWWFRRSEFAEEIIKENSNVQWYPKSAKNTFDNLMRTSGDWAISRQRYWGIPLPIFEDEDGNYRVFGSKEELEKEIGKTLDDLHLDNLKGLIVKNPKNGKDMTHVGLTADVWFDSGCASFASHYGEGMKFDEIIKNHYPMSWITEGEDQIRGWFSSLFNVGYMATGKAPYNKVLFQRFIMDKDGQKMSKSLGNGISGNESIERFGSDASRYYLLSKRAPEDQINFDLDEFSNVEGFFNTLENVTKYMDSYLKEHGFKDSFCNMGNLDVEDKWILYSLSKTVDSFKNHFEHFRLNQAISVVETFVVKDLSKTYLKIIKERTEEKDENLLAIFGEILKKTLMMLSVAIPFKAEYLYQSTSLPFKKESIFLDNFPESDKVLIKEVESKKINENFELVQDIIQSVLNAREKAKIGVRWPLGQIDIISSKDLKSSLEPFEKLIQKIANISKISYDLKDVEINYIVKPNFATLKQDFKNPSDAIKAINLSKFYISEDLKAGEITGVYEGVELDLEKHIIKEIELKGEFISSDFNGGSVILHTHQDEILLEEGFSREIVRRIQQKRKDLGLSKEERISLSFAGSEEYILEICSNYESTICRKVGAVEVLENELENREDYEIKDKKLSISLKRI